MKGSARNCIAIGAGVGLLDGLAFALSYHSSFDFLAPWLLPIALPCFAVVMRFPTGSDTPDWVPWTAGVLTMALIGSAAGWIVHWLRECRKPVAQGLVPSTHEAEQPHPTLGGR